MNDIKLPDWVKVGAIFKCFDEDDLKWYKTKILKIVENKIYCQDIDKNSSCPDLKFEITFEEIFDTKYAREIKK